VFVHEGGHFVTAKLCKIKVNEFSIGFGKNIWYKKHGDTLYAIRMIPLGGFVRLEGEETPSDEIGSFSNAKIWQKMLIVVSGGLVNIIFALVIFLLLVTIYYKYPLVNAIKLTGNYSYSVIESLKTLFSGNASPDNLVGPIGISNIIVKTTDLANYIYLISAVSISLGFTNLLPIPPLDGGKFLIYLIEALRKKPIKQETEIAIQMTGFVFIIALSIFVMINDIGNI
jgi:membrane-associated protease RseP (regulator of RpoE activity)